ncbi:MAG: T9SS type A sorting domain-containing protein, partial [Saprospiraceae bacterium]|nr:T9SS type A sorting domain-containing protein [Saprospiraceae bacterium]
AFFIPNNCGDWRQESIDLTPFTGGVVEISIENMGESGNYLYLDNIDISSPQIPNLAPMVQIDAPMNGTTMQEPGTQLPILAQAYDEDGYVKEVVLYVNGDSVAVDDKLPFAFDFEWEDFGNYNFQLLAKDNDEAISWSETVEVELIPVNTRTIIAEGWTIDIYPNPARSQFQVFMEAPGMTQVQYELWDISGKKVMHGNWHLTEGQQTRMLSGGHLPKGLYQLRLYGEEQFISQQKIVFQ